MLRRSFASQGLVMLAGLALIVIGIACLYLSDQVVHGWWQGTLDAFGVGFIVGGVVDALAISGLNQAIKAEDQRLLDQKREMDSILALRRAAMKQQGRLLEGEQAAEWARSFLNSHGSTINRCWPASCTESPIYGHPQRRQTRVTLPRNPETPEPAGRDAA